MQIRLLHSLPSYLASRNGHLNIVKYLTVERNCDPAVRDHENGTPLHFTAGKTCLTTLDPSNNALKLDILLYKQLRSSNNPI